LENEKSICRDPALQSTIRGRNVGAEIADVAAAVD
jgi:hypothetical protein